jgi:polyphosphate kinase
MNNGNKTKIYFKLNGLPDASVISALFDELMSM